MQEVESLEKQLLKLDQEYHKPLPTITISHEGFTQYSNQEEDEFDKNIVIPSDKLERGEKSKNLNEDLNEDLKLSHPVPKPDGEVERLIAVNKGNVSRIKKLNTKITTLVSQLDGPGPESEDDTDLKNKDLELQILQLK